jgi:hypothetical protein
MSLNFPTAFWKDSNPSDEDVEFSIDWDLYLYYSEEVASDDPYNPNPFKGAENAKKATQDSNGFFSAIAGAFPYTVGGRDYYDNYDANLTADGNNSFFGWYLTGYDQNDLSDFHRANPWILDNNGKELNLFFESDQATVEKLGRNQTYGTKFYDEIFNNFIQSGYAEGSFTLTSDSNLSITVSGLGEKKATDFEKMHLAVDGVHICKGGSPGGGTSTNGWDMNQVKLFNSDGDQTPTQYADRDGGTYVDQDNRRFGYTTAAGQATFTTGLGDGEHTIKIYFNTNDGLYNSGAFYGFKFNFS